MLINIYTHVCTHIHIYTHICTHICMLISKERLGYAAVTNKPKI